MIKATSIDGVEFDLSKLEDFTNWEIKLLDEDGKLIILGKIGTLITCWIEKEREAYAEAHE